MSSKRSATLISSKVSKLAANKKQKQAHLSGFFSSSANKPSPKSSKLSSLESNMLPPPRFKIFCDMDGVLCDFDAGVKKLCNGQGPEELPSQGVMWGAIHKSDGFYERLPWTRDGKRLWKAILSSNPDILTGVSRSKRCRLEKASWCSKELGVTTNHVDMAGKKSGHEMVRGRRKEGVVNVITCWSRNKHLESVHGTVLIDDRAKLASKWEEAGGVFIHHTDTESTLEKLKTHGILTNTEIEDDDEEREAVISSPQLNRKYDLPFDTP